MGSYSGHSTMGDIFPGHPVLRWPTMLTQGGAKRKSVAWVMNHLHIADIHTGEELTEDMASVLSQTLPEIYAAKLAYQFPHAPCIVEVYRPEEACALLDYQISFWQRKHE